jgi:hypothetical protein
MNRGESMEDEGSNNKKDHVLGSEKWEHGSIGRME